MKLRDILNYVGDEGLSWQKLSESMTNIATNKKGISKITFSTDAITANDVMLVKQKRIGIIIWIDADKLPKETNETTQTQDRARTD